MGASPRQEASRSSTDPESLPVDPRRSRGCSPAGVAKNRRNRGAAGCSKTCVDRGVKVRKVRKALEAVRGRRLAIIAI
jgi:hypothetical protein